MSFRTHAAFRKYEVGESVYRVGWILANEYFIAEDPAVPLNEIVKQAVNLARIEWTTH